MSCDLGRLLYGISYTLLCDMSHIWSQNITYYHKIVDRLCLMMSYDIKYCCATLVIVI